MTEILFYHLRGRPVESALPGLLERCVERGWRTRVQVDSEERMRHLCSHLWTYREDSFLPHADDGDADAANQPVLITISPQNINQATVCFLINGVETAELKPFDRVVMLFDGDDEAAVSAARAQWAALNDAYECTYWQQDEGARWINKSAAT